VTRYDNIVQVPGAIEPLSFGFLERRQTRRRRSSLILISSTIRRVGTSKTGFLGGHYDCYYCRSMCSTAAIC
jgi:hypothetical protein